MAMRFGIYRKKGLSGTPIKDRLRQLPARILNKMQLTYDVPRGLAAAYSLRKIVKTYTGSAIRVRRSSDNLELDIGFSGERLNTTALLAHVGANNGFIVTIYDQTGNLRHLSQAVAAAQPQIVAAGAIIVRKLLPAILFDGVGDVMTATIPSLNAHTINIVTTPLNSGTDLGILNYSTNTVNQSITVNAGTTTKSYFGGSGNFVSTASAVGTQNTITRIWNGIADINRADLYRNGQGENTRSGTPTTTSATTTLNLGRAVAFGQQHFQELTIYTTPLTEVQRKNLHRNQANYYKIGVYPAPVLEQLSVSPAAAYSLRRLSQSATRAIQVRRSSDNTTLDIGFVDSDLDVASLLAFVGVNNGFVTTWYDQAGSFNATQAVALAQPAIVTSGVVNYINGRPALSNTAATAIVATGLTTLNTAHSISAVASNTSNAGRIVSMRSANPLNPILDFVSSTSLRFFVRDDTSTNSISLTQAVANNTLLVTTGIRNTNTGFLFVNGNVTSANSTPGPIGTTTTSGGLGIGGDVSVASCLNGNISEIVVFNSALSTSDRQILERDQGRYYAISVA
jgi:hypothetical protein